MKLFEILLFLTVSSIAHADDFYFQAPYKFIKTEFECHVAIKPKNLAGAEVCVYIDSMLNAAKNSGVFEANENDWQIIGPGIPNYAKSTNLYGVNVVYGESLCGIEDAAGFHGAGAKCFYGMAGNDNKNIIFKSKPVDLRRWGPKKSKDARDMFFSVIQSNFDRKP